MITGKSSNLFEVLSPWADADPVPSRGITPRLTDLAGKKIGLLANSKRASRPILAVVERKLKERFPSAQISWYFTEYAVGPAEVDTENKARFEDWLRGIDAVVAAVGDRGACTKYLVYETISVEERSKPAVGLIYKDFANDARSAASSKGMSVVRLVPETVPSEWTNLADIDISITAVMDNIVTALTAPLTSEEKSPSPNEREKSSRIIFKGNLEEVNRFFYLRGWTDGLPIIPPTEEAVAEMLAGTDLPPQHIVAMMAPRMGKATIEKIAINAVMAGALPTYMPLLIAGVKAQTDPRTGPTGLAVSTTSIAPLWVVNGPVRRDLNINYGYGALSPGDIANAAIGRALGLITKNIRGVRKGMEDMGVLGNPGRYTMLVAENEEDSPWEPLHVEHGFKKEDSTLTIAFALSFSGLMPYGTDDKGILHTIISNLMSENDGGLFVMLSPPLAKVLASAGWTKKNIKNHIIENATTPLIRHPQYWATVRDSPEKAKTMNLQEPTAILRRTRIADPVLLFVAGGSGTRIGLFSSGPREWVTKKVELPANWNKLVEKYKNLVPSYLKY